MKELYCGTFNASMSSKDIPLKLAPVVQVVEETHFYHF